MEVEKLVSMTVLPEVTWVFVTGHTRLQLSSTPVVLTSHGRAAVVVTPAAVLVTVE